MIREIPVGFRSLFTGLARFYLLVWHPLWCSPAFLTHSLTWCCVLPFTQVVPFPSSPLRVLCLLRVQNREVAMLPTVETPSTSPENLKKGQIVSSISEPEIPNSRIWTSNLSFYKPCRQTTCKYIKLEKPWAILELLFQDTSKHPSLLRRDWTEVQWVQQAAPIQKVSVYSNTKWINSIEQYESFWLITEN